MIKIEFTRSIIATSILANLFCQILGTLVRDSAILSSVFTVKNKTISQISMLFEFEIQSIIFYRPLIQKKLQLETGCTTKTL